MARMTLALGMAAVALLAACSSADDATEPEAEVSVSQEAAVTSMGQLAGRTFVAGEATLVAQGQQPIANSVIELSFTEDAISGTGGCNRFNGAATITDGQLVLDDGLAATMMACDEALEAQQQYVTDVLASEPEVYLADEVLTRLGPDDALVLTQQE